jgi:hypothetical protein
MNTIQTQDAKITAKCGSCKFETMGKNGYLICSNKKSGHYYIDISDTCGFSEAKEMIEYFRCWKCNDNKRYTKQELLKRIEEENIHIDYCCPICKMVVICCNTIQYYKNTNAEAKADNTTQQTFFSYKTSAVIHGEKTTTQHNKVIMRNSQAVGEKADNTTQQNFFLCEPSAVIHGEKANNTTQHHKLRKVEEKEKVYSIDKNNCKGVNEK